MAGAGSREQDELRFVPIELKTPLEDQADTKQKAA